MTGLNKATIDALCPAKTDFVVWDRGRLPGFGLKVTPAGRKVFILDARIEGRSRRITLGRYGPLTLDGARRLANLRLSEIASGQDPTAAKRAVRSLPTVAQLCDLYLEAAEAGLVATRFGRAKKPSTIVIDRGMINRHIKPLLGDIRFERLTRAYVQRMIDSVAAGKTAQDVRTKARGRSRVVGGEGHCLEDGRALGRNLVLGIQAGIRFWTKPDSGHRSVPVSTFRPAFEQSRTESAR